MMLYSKIALGLWALTPFLSVSAQTAGRTIEVVNQSGKKLVVDWIHPETGESVTLTDSLSNGAKTAFDTFVNHTFAVHEPINSPTCGDLAGDGSECGVQYITVNHNTDQVAIIKKGLVVAYKDSEARAKEEVASQTEECHEVAREQLAKGANANKTVEALVDCLKGAATELVQQKNEEIAFETKVRLELSRNLENHTCADPTRQTSEPEEIRSWTHEDYPGEEVTRDILVLHDRPSSQIHALVDFISKEECDAITAAAKPKLHKGTVADGAGGSMLSDNRKAWQAGLRIPWEREEAGDPIARVVRRVYDYTNHAVGYNLSIEGQEDLMSIQYFGIGQNSTESPDQYRPHCDGDCDGLPHKTGGRVATMVMYCDAPELGGGTNFQNANVFVKPTVGYAAFFSYLNIETMEKELGYTTHSGCPVIEGTKRIAVHWMRHGVDKKNRWSDFNTLTIKREEEDC
eukprot:Nitzschia sp. Nitz4//scaffold25_size161228//97841//99217//NITZ4_002439-RA/size161228-processed-gene-0.165-mRNA-1//1//CDS//3329544613//2394//frame0